jgi:hypothetical protein
MQDVKSTGRKNNHLKLNKIYKPTWTQPRQPIYHAQFSVAATELMHDSKIGACMGEVEDRTSLIH